MMATMDEVVRRWKEERRLLSTTQMDPDTEAGVGHQSKLGIGLPMCNIFVRYVR